MYVYTCLCACMCSCGSSVCREEAKIVRSLYHHECGVGLCSNGRKGSEYGWFNFVLAIGIISWLCIMVFLALIFTGNQIEPVVVCAGFVYSLL